MSLELIINKVLSLEVMVVLKRTFIISRQEMLSSRDLLGGSFLGFLGQKNSLDVGQDTSLSDGHTRQQFVQFLVITDSQLQMTWDDSCFLVVTSSVTGQFQNFSGQILENSSQIHGGTSAHTFGVVALSQQTVNTTDWELKPSTARARLALSLDFSSLSTSRHVDSLAAIKILTRNFSKIPFYTAREE